MYDPKTAEAISKTTLPEQIKFVVSYGAEFVPSGSLPTLSHVPAGVDTTKSPKGGKVHTYTLTSATECTSPSSAWSFTLPLSTAYHPPSSSLSHTRSLTFIKPIQGGPYFDIEAVWEEHTKYEFETRDVEKTMGTMVREPYVNHVPTVSSVSCVWNEKLGMRLMSDWLGVDDWWDGEGEVDGVLHKSFHPGVSPPSLPTVFLLLSG